MRIRSTLILLLLVAGVVQPYCAEDFDYQAFRRASFVPPFSDYSTNNVALAVLNVYGPEMSYYQIEDEPHLDYPNIAMTYVGIETESIFECTDHSITYTPNIRRDVQCWVEWHW